MNLLFRRLSEEPGIGGSLLELLMQLPMLTVPMCNTILFYIRWTSPTNITLNLFRTLREM